MISTPWPPLAAMTLLPVVAVTTVPTLFLEPFSITTPCPALPSATNDSGTGGDGGSASGGGVV